MWAVARGRTILIQIRLMPDNPCGRRLRRQQWMQANVQAMACLDQNLRLVSCTSHPIFIRHGTAPLLQTFNVQQRYEAVRRIVLLLYSTREGRGLNCSLCLHWAQ
jgi:hypothetical protein